MHVRSSVGTNTQATVTVGLVRQLLMPILKRARLLIEKSISTVREEAEHCGPCIEEKRKGVIVTPLFRVYIIQSLFYVCGGVDSCNNTSCRSRQMSDLCGVTASTLTAHGLGFAA